MSNAYPRVLHIGPYDGCEIDYVVDLDPAYIIEAADDPASGISQTAVNRARRLLDNHDEWDDYSYAEDQARAFGLTVHEYNE